MGKAPAFQFYIKDWLSDPQLKMASFSTKGIWIDMLCYMWGAKDRGTITGKREELSRMIGSNGIEFDTFLDDAERLGFCDISVTDNKIITLCNRRMYRDDKERKNNRLRQERFREKQKRNEEITPPSPSPSPTTKKKDTSNSISYLTKRKRKLTGKRLESFELFWDAFNYKTGKAEAADSWLDIPELTDSLVTEIISAAKITATARKEIVEKGGTPKMGQGWISARRWEDEVSAEPKTIFVEDE